MSNASTIKRQVGGNILGTIAPLLGSVLGVSDPFSPPAFQLNPGPTGASGNTGIALGGVVPLSAGTPSNISPTGLGTDYIGSTLDDAPKFRGVFEGQILHVA